MKFLLCWGVMRPDRVVKSEEEEEETARLAPLSPARRRRRVRRASAGEAEWKPSLSAISEDMVTIEKKKKKEEEEEKKKRASSERVANSKRKTSTAPSRARVLVRSYSDDYERSRMPTIIPTFAPAPFMF
ncbi:hypothetical protein RGQ29_027079 [Quercus rubra]|uniref:Uncharacterized protein n=1 Tax=Quercus rubra TaxID=3512 RepID=A0AAN7ENE8_QUERU|nr:hypothetical protein RGQ29_027079 [Quercus rubra]